jgi:hypothetical protein
MYDLNVTLRTHGLWDWKCFTGSSFYELYTELLVCHEVTLHISYCAALFRLDYLHDSELNGTSAYCKASQIFRCYGLWAGNSVPLPEDTSVQDFQAKPEAARFGSGRHLRLL